MINIPGLEKMDPESRAQAVQAAIIQSIEEMQKQVAKLSIDIFDLTHLVFKTNELINAHGIRLSDLESAQKPRIEVKPEIKVDTQGITDWIRSKFWHGK